MPVAFGYSPAPLSPDLSPPVYTALPCPLAAAKSDKRAETDLVSQHSQQGQALPKLRWLIAGKRQKTDFPSLFSIF